ncbi:MAG: 50S ribosomal protein P1 [Candidatus Diapherotrites archaeon]|nr:50S ribosomal protein P1 [Candidatus Diapherotrites archaeon]
MEYIYSALLLHAAGKEITEEAVTNVLKAAGIEVDAAKVKALIASLKEVNIEEAIQKAATVQVAPAAKAAETKAEAAEEEKKEEEEEQKTEEEAASGLSALFG